VDAAESGQDDFTNPQLLGEQMSKQMGFFSDGPEQDKTLFWMKKLSLWASLLLLVMLPFLLPSAGMAQESTEGADTRPNIVLLVADDAGFSDFPKFGGEALTPNVDALTDAGMKLTNFHVLPTCSATRSVILSGVEATHLRRDSKGPFFSCHSERSLATQAWR